MSTPRGDVWLPGKVAKIFTTPMPDLAPPIPKAQSAQEMHDENTIVVTAAEAGFKTGGVKAGRERDTGEDRNRELDLHMFRYNHIGVNSAIAVSLTQYNELADAVTKGRKKEGMKRGKWLQNRIAGLPKDGFKLKDLSPDTNWLALYVIHAVRTSNAWNHLHNLRCAYQALVLRRPNGMTVDEGNSRKGLLESTYIVKLRKWQEHIDRQISELDSEYEKSRSSSARKQRSRVDMLEYALDKANAFKAELSRTYEKKPSQCTRAVEAGSANDLWCPMPYYSELDAGEVSNFWRIRFGEDEAARMYSAISNSVAIKENFAHPHWGRLMATTFIVTCSVAWKKFIRPRLCQIEALERAQTNAIWAAVAKNEEVFVPDRAIVHEYFRGVSRRYQNVKGFPAGIEEVLVPKNVAQLSRKRKRNNGETMMESDMNFGL